MITKIGVANYSNHNYTYPANFYLLGKSFITALTELNGVALPNYVVSDLSGFNFTAYSGSFTQILNYYLDSSNLSFTLNIKPYYTVAEINLKATNTLNSSLEFESTITTSVFYAATQPYYTPVQALITIDENSFLLYLFTTNYKTLERVNCFIGSFSLIEVNTTHNYYNGKDSNRFFIISAVNNNNLSLKYKLYDTVKIPNFGEPSNFPIVCADNRKPQGNWLTNALFFDDNSILKHPLMGKASNSLMMGIGDYTIDQPVEINDGLLQPMLYVAQVGSSNKSLFFQVQV